MIVLIQFASMLNQPQTSVRVTKSLCVTTEKPGSMLATWKGHLNQQNMPLHGAVIQDKARSSYETLMKDAKE
jgi:hypothetical protein